MSCWMGDACVVETKQKKTNVGQKRGGGRHRVHAKANRKFTTETLAVGSMIKANQSPLCRQKFHSSNCCVHRIAQGENVHHG